MPADRRKTLETLLELASGDDSGGCWDPSRARELLRGQSSREELESLGADPTLIEELWPENRDW
ncbi:MAG TPA: hypothetical protein VM557_14115 [Thermoanaerobaculia bacterium]|nr:hypothetical protein [Thermoanaerobaculia bacterium]